MNLKKQEGITLIVLVITIIIILLIVGTSVGTILSRQGLLKSAQEAQNVQKSDAKNEEDKTKELINNVDSIERNPIKQETQVSLNRSRGTLEIHDEDTIQLTATVTPKEVTNKTVTWSSSDSTIAIVDVNGLVTGKKEGNVIITATANDGSGKKADCTITVTDIWAKMNRAAIAIAKDTTINNSSSQTSGTTEKGEQYDIKVGDIYKVKYDGEIRRVRVLGFKHDDLVNTGVYENGITATKASISFEFYDFITGDSYMQMNTSDTNSGGWGSTKIRTELNGSSSTLGGSGAKLSNKEYIKQVKKKYIPTFNIASTQTCNDYLWLLACSEVWNSGYQANAYAYAITSEGSQYKYYQGVTEAYNADSPNRVKYNASGSADYWWFRSPYYHNSNYFCYVFTTGNSDVIYADDSCGVAPGFCI